MFHFKYHMRRSPVLQIFGNPVYVSSLCGPGMTFSKLVVNPTILTTKRSAVRQQTVSIVPKVDISGLCEPLCAVRRRSQMRTAEITHRRIWCANPADVLFRSCLSPALLLFLHSAQFRVAKSPNHPTEIHEKRTHDHNHERVGLYHRFGDRRRHFWRCAGLDRCASETVCGRGGQCRRHHPGGWTTSAATRSGNK